MIWGIPCFIKPLFHGDWSWSSLLSAGKLFTWTYCYWMLLYIKSSRYILIIKLWCVQMDPPRFHKIPTIHCLSEKISHGFGYFGWLDDAWHKRRRKKNDWWFRTFPARGFKHDLWLLPNDNGETNRKPPDGFKRKNLAPRKKNKPNEYPQQQQTTIIYTWKSQQLFVGMMFGSCLR